jgi:hypothetical protein
LLSELKLLWDRRHQPNGAETIIMDITPAQLNRCAAAIAAAAAARRDSTAVK